MRTRLAFGLLGAALIASIFANYRFFQTIERQQNHAPIDEWIGRLSVNRDVVADTGNTLSDRTLTSVQQFIYLDLKRIKQQEELSPGRFGAGRVEHLEEILGSINALRRESPELFAAPKLEMADESLGSYIKLLSSSDR